MGGDPLAELGAVDAGVVELLNLLAQGADAVLPNREGLTPLSIAQEKNHREAAAFLRRHGA